MSDTPQSRYQLVYYPDSGYHLGGDAEYIASGDSKQRLACRALEHAREYYSAEQLKLRLGEEEPMPADSIAVYEPGQPGNVVVEPTSAEHE
jgi:hypothetical protein